jgi:hypothetical protein
MASRSERPAEMRARDAERGPPGVTGGKRSGMAIMEHEQRKRGTPRRMASEVAFSDSL